MTPSEALEYANGHFSGRKGMLEVLTDSMVDASNDNGFSGIAKAHARRARKIIPTVPQGGEHKNQGGGGQSGPSKPKQADTVTAPVESAVSMVQKPRARRG
jgi:hypothetical protein